MMIYQYDKTHNVMNKHIRAMIFLDQQGRIGGIQKLNARNKFFILVSDEFVLGRREYFLHKDRKDSK